MVALLELTRSESKRPNHEGRTEGEVRPGSVEQAIRQAHSILAGAGVALSPSKVTRLCRDFIRTSPPCTFRTYIARNARSVPVRSLPGGGRVPAWQLDPTGNTAVHNVDPSAAVEVSASA